MREQYAKLQVWKNGGNFLDRVNKTWKGMNLICFLNFPSKQQQVHCFCGKLIILGDNINLKKVSELGSTQALNLSPRYKGHIFEKISGELHEAGLT